MKNVWFGSFRNTSGEVDLNKVTWTIWIYVKLGVLIYLASHIRIDTQSDILGPNNFFLASYEGCSPNKLTNEFSGLRAKDCPVNYKAFNASYRAE